MFETKIAEISAQVEKIDPVEYARSRNFLKRRGKRGFRRISVAA